MPRPNKATGEPARKARKVKLTFLTIRNAKPEKIAYFLWDTYLPGLGLRVQPSGAKSFHIVYRFCGARRDYYIGNADAVTLEAAHDATKKIIARVADGGDPVAERRAQMTAGTFAELAQKYVREYSERNNKSWKQARALVTNHLVPKWGKLRAGAVTRGHVKSVMRNLESTPTLANQVKAAASAIFTWAITEEVGGVKENPCKLIKTNDTTSRERILSDSEVSAFWKSFDRAGPVRAAALRVLLLCGQRPGEIGKMRAEHVKDNWWGLPGAPVPALGWDGTKNKQNHRVWLSTAVVAIIKELHGGNLPATGFVFRNARGDGPIADIGGAMRDINKHLGIIDDPAKPHDLRRSFCSMVTKLKFGRDAMDRLSNHKESGVTDVYDRTNYSEEDMRIWETVAAKFLELVEGKSESNVVNLRG